MVLTDPVTSEDEDLNSSEMLVARARFHTVMAKSLSHRMLKERKEGRKRTEARKRKEYKKQVKAKKETVGIEKQKDMKDDKKSKKTKKKKVIEVSKDDITEKTKRWWTLGSENRDTEEGKHTEEDKPTEEVVKKTKTKTKSKDKEKSKTKDKKDKTKTKNKSKTKDKKDKTKGKTKNRSKSKTKKSRSRSKSKSRSRSNRREDNDFSEFSITEVTVTETTCHSTVQESLGESQQWSVSYPIAASKIIEDENEGENTEYTANVLDQQSDEIQFQTDNKAGVPMWWNTMDEAPPTPTTAQEKPRSLPLMMISPYLSSPAHKKVDRKPTPTIWQNKKPVSLPLMMPSPGVSPAQKKKAVSLPVLLGCNSLSSESDYDDVSLFDEVSLSEHKQILDDLSCILNCDDDESDCSISVDNHGVVKRSKRRLTRWNSSRSDGSSTIDSEKPFCPKKRPLRSSLKKNTDSKFSGTRAYLITPKKNTEGTILLDDTISSVIENAISPESCSACRRLKHEPLDGVVMVREPGLFSRNHSARKSADPSPPTPPSGRQLLEP